MPEFTGGFDKKKMFEAFKNFFRQGIIEWVLVKIGEKLKDRLNQDAYTI